MNRLLRSVIASINQKRRYVLITDEKVYKIYGQRIMSCFSHVELILVPNSEECKARLVKERVEDQLFALRINRGDALVALGGGAVLDLVGFVAATYMRGIDYYCIPTTLLAMVDACIGGKCAINHPQGKNLLGVYNCPKQVFTSTCFLKSLKQSQINDAMAEVIKYGVIADKGIFKMLNDDFSTLIFRCQSIKKQIVRLDQKDKSIRNCLNFGHTIGHAIESLSGFRFTHGQAVSIGICVELEICHRMCALTRQSVRMVKALLASYSLPTAIEGIDERELLERCFYDKKALDLPRFVLTDNLGSCLPFDGSYLKEIDRDSILEVLCPS